MMFIKKSLSLSSYSEDKVMDILQYQYLKAFKELKEYMSLMCINQKERVRLCLFDRQKP